MAKRKYGAQQNGPQVSIDNNEAGLTLTLHNDTAAHAETVIPVTGSREFEDERPQVIANIKGPVPLLLTVHRFDIGGTGVHVNTPGGETLRWEDEADFHKSYRREFNGDIVLHWNDGEGGISEVVWSIQSIQ